LGRSRVVTAPNLSARRNPRGMNKDELDGKADALKGRVKQGAGDLTNNDRLRDEGAAEEAGGEIEEGFGKARRKVGDAIEDVGDKKTSSS